MFRIFFSIVATTLGIFLLFSAFWLLEDIVKSIEATEGDGLNSLLFVFMGVVAMYIGYYIHKYGAK